jgi:hypothetical protein
VYGKPLKTVAVVEEGAQPSVRQINTLNVNLVASGSNSVCRGDGKGICSFNQVPQWSFSAHTVDAYTSSAPVME